MVPIVHLALYSHTFYYLGPSCWDQQVFFLCAVGILLRARESEGDCWCKNHNHFVNQLNIRCTRTLWQKRDSRSHFMDLSLYFLKKRNLYYLLFINELWFHFAAKERSDDVDWIYYGWKSGKHTSIAGPTVGLTPHPRPTWP